MKEQEITNRKKDITRLLLQRQLRDAMDALKAFIVDSKEEKIQNLLERVEGQEETYQLMLQYMRKGAKDPKRNAFYVQLAAEIWSLTEQTELALLDEASPYYYHTAYKTYHLGNKQGVTLSAMREQLENYPDEMALSQLGGYQNIDDILARHEEAQQDLFLTTWSNRMWSAEVEAEAKAMLTSVNLAAGDLCLFVSAVALSTLQCFDPRKIHWLLDAYRHDSVQVNQRALVSLAIILYVQDILGERFHFVPDLKEHFMQTFEDEKDVRALNRVFIQMLMTQETGEVNRRIRDEIMPEMVKSITTLQRMAREELDDNDNDYNPEWGKEFYNEMSRKELADAMQAMAEWQKEGIDIYLSSFGQPMRYFPFFRKMQNWFYPFDPMHSSLVHNVGLTEYSRPDSILQRFMEISPLCDCDKYTFCFIWQQSTVGQRQQMDQNIARGLGSDGSEEQKEQFKEMHEHVSTPAFVSNNYMHDLYRFYHIYQRSAEFHNPFGADIRLYESSQVGELLNQTRFLMPVGDFLFSKERYAEAYDAYETILKKHDAGLAEIQQKAGFCLQKLDFFDEAIAYYERADDLKPNNVWNLRHMASCYRMLKQYDKALEYYKRVEEIQPDNRNVQLYMGHCLVELGRTEEALQYFFKLELADESNIKAWRGIAWCSLLQRKDEQTVKYYEKILSATPNAADYLNAGHMYWIQGDLPRALQLYKEAAKRMADHNILHKAFENDTRFLVSQGINADDIPLVVDMIE
jgi:tetratricopeptide (TPR) repeat protein